MLEVDRQIKATLLRAIPILVAVGMMGTYYHYWSKSPAAANPEAMRELQRMREEGYRDEMERDLGNPMQRFSGTLTAAQKDALLGTLTRAGKYSVDIIPIDKVSEGSSIPPAASKASAEEFASLFWKAGWDARVFEGNPHPASRPLGTIALVINPDSTAQSPRRGRKAAQILLEALKQNGIAAVFYSSNKVDPETFEMHISVNTAPQ
jgi:type IV pilus biogenesis protein CpaD/CtpE